MRTVEQEFKLGDPVEFTRHLRRRSYGEGMVTLKEWTSAGYPGQPDPESRKGVVVGVRTLSDGGTHRMGYDEPVEYRPTRHFRAYLIAFDLRRSPVLVLPEHVTADS